MFESEVAVAHALTGLILFLGSDVVSHEAQSPLALKGQRAFPSQC